MSRAIDHLNALTLARLAWLERDAAKVRAWRAEDAANGIFWQTPRERVAGNRHPNDR